MPTWAAPHQRIVTAGASIGAFNAVALLCRFPDIVRGRDRDERHLPARSGSSRAAGPRTSSSPRRSTSSPASTATSSTLLRQRRVILASGEGAHEDIGESWAVADVLGQQGRAEPRRLLGSGVPSTTGPPGGRCCRSTSTRSAERRSSRAPRRAARGAAPRPGRPEVEVGQVEALVGAVRAGVGVLDAGDQDLRVGERLGERCRRSRWSRRRRSRRPVPRTPRRTPTWPRRRPDRSSSAAYGATGAARRSP